MVENGIGTRNTIDSDVTISRPIPGWVTLGRHLLLLSENGDLLEGEYQPHTGSGHYNLDELVNRQ